MCVLIITLLSILLQLRHSVSVGAFSLDDSDISTSPWKSPEQHVVKVYLDTQDSHHSNHYKSIIVSIDSEQ